MIKHIFATFFLFCLYLSVDAQREIILSDSLSITGSVSIPLTYSIADLDTFPQTEIGDRILYNHKGEVKDTLTGLKGIPIKSLLAQITFIYEKPKELNEYYFVFIATDNYKVAFSWNEIYNTSLGDQYFVITETEGKKIREMDQRILFMSTGDIQTGRRHIKALRTIDVRRAE